MRVLFGVIAATLIASCGAGVTNQSANSAAETNGLSRDPPAPGNAASSNAAADAPGNALQGNATAAAEPDGGWAGHYRGDLDVEIREGRGPGRYRVEISTTSGGGCMGVVSGTATANGDRLAFVGVDEEAAPGAQCRITLSRRGNSLNIEEGEGCTDFHGAMCTFDGTAARRSR